MAVVVDLKARIVGPDREVWVARPGKGYKLYRDFIENDIIAPDLPFLQLEKGKTLAQHPDLEQRIRRSRAIRSWYRRKMEGDKPSLELSSYDDARGDKSVVSLRTTLSGFFEKLNTGDLVIVPPGAYAHDAYIGEVVAEKSDYLRIKTQVYPDDRLTGRAVNWLAKIQKRRLPTSILNALEHPTSIYLLPRSQRTPIYEAAYQSYVDLSKGTDAYTARFNVASDSYTTSTDFLLTAFFNAVASTQQNLDGGVDVRTDFQKAAFDDLGQYALDLRTNINSPGFLTLSSKFATPLIAAVLFALATQVGPAAPTELANNKVIIGNSLAPDGDRCSAEVFQGTLDQLKLLGLANEWVTACRMAKLAAERGQVTGTVTVERTP
jgi:hypothetical protein